MILSLSRSPMNISVSFCQSRNHLNIFTDYKQQTYGHLVSTKSCFKLAFWELLLTARIPSAISQMKTDYRSLFCHERNVFNQNPKCSLISQHATPSFQTAILVYRFFYVWKHEKIQKILKKISEICSLLDLINEARTGKKLSRLDIARPGPHLATGLLTRQVHLLQSQLPELQLWKLNWDDWFCNWSGQWKNN